MMACCKPSQNAKESGPFLWSAFFLPFEKYAAVFQNHWKFQKSEVGIFLKISFWSLPKSNTRTFRYGAMDFYARHKKE
ncbi:hypothetical protein DN53_05715 [Flagellimonas olearia]|uniref:Uncharacterized protein n=1 Tax=Flagellimonas olearia TaxID=552546 RepID=A0A444VI23_9FLAO|nr:hypothetical protein DN53_05715 [Allomuricauda olearia]